MTAGRVLCWVASLQPPEHTSIGSDPPAPSPGAPADPPFLPWGPQRPGFSHEATPAFPCLGELPETLSARQPLRPLAQTVVGLSASTILTFVPTASGGGGLLSPGVVTGPGLLLPPTQPGVFGCAPWLLS